MSSQKKQYAVSFIDHTLNAFVASITNKNYFKLFVNFKTIGKFDAI